jgi:hypothetical protein
MSMLAVFELGGFTIVPVMSLAEQKWSYLDGAIYVVARSRDEAERVAVEAIKEVKRWREESTEQPPR